MIDLTIQGLRLVSEANAHEHFRIRHKRVIEHHRATEAALARFTAKPPLPLMVVITRLAPRSLDSDNLVGCGKGCRDSLAQWLGIDDKSPEVTWFVTQEKSKTYGARIVIQPRTFTFTVHPTGIQIHTPALITPGLTVTVTP